MALSLGAIFLLSLLTEPTAFAASAEWQATDLALQGLIEVGSTGIIPADACGMFLGPRAPANVKRAPTAETATEVKISLKCEAMTQDLVTRAAGRSFPEVEARKREVHFYDTPECSLANANVTLRRRRDLEERKDESGKVKKAKDEWTMKVKNPASPDPSWIESQPKGAEVKLEKDFTRKGESTAYSYSRKTEISDADPLSNSLITKEQIEFLKANASQNSAGKWDELLAKIERKPGIRSLQWKSTLEIRDEQGTVLLPAAEVSFEKWNRPGEEKPCVFEVSLKTDAGADAAKILGALEWRFGRENLAEDQATKTRQFMNCP